MPAPLHRLAYSTVTTQQTTLLDSKAGHLCPASHTRGGPASCQAGRPAQHKNELHMGSDASYGSLHSSVYQRGAPRGEIRQKHSASCRPGKALGASPVKHNIFCTWTLPGQSRIATGDRGKPGECSSKHSPSDSQNTASRPTKARNAGKLATSVPTFATSSGTGFEQRKQTAPKR